MRIERARPTGLCFGVRRAIMAVEQALAEEKSVYALGSPIHNPQEVARLETGGLHVVECVDQVPDGATAFIRAHGVAPSVIERLKNKNSHVIDGTCPFVRMVQRRAKELSDTGYHLLILGDEKHPEVAGILGCVSGCTTVVHSVDALLASTILRSSARIPKLGLVSQTTQEERILAAVAEAVIQKADELRVFNTICHATRERQKAVADLSGRVDGMVVIGGHDSANTGKLYRIACEAGHPVLWIEHAGQLDRRWVLEKNIIGVAAGASTPDWLIEQSIKAMENIAGCQGDVSYE